MPFGFSLGVLQQQDAGLTSPLAKLLHWWDCEETAGTRFDSHGSLDISVISGANYTTGIKGNALNFNGSDYVRTSDGGIPADGGRNSFAMAFWVHWDTRSGTDFMVWRCDKGVSGSTTPCDWMCAVGDWNHLPFFQISIDGNANDWDGSTLYADTAIAAGQTRFIYFHYNSATEEMGIAIDDGPLLTMTNTVTRNWVEDTLRWGEMSPIYPHGLDGWQDSIGYFNGPLTDGERLWLWNGGLGREYSDF